LDRLESILMGEMMVSRAARRAAAAGGLRPLTPSSPRKKQHPSDQGRRVIRVSNRETSDTCSTSSSEISILLPRPNLRATNLTILLRLQADRLGDPGDFLALFLDHRDEILRAAGAHCLADGAKALSERR